MVESAAAAMHWLTDTDRAAVDLAVTLARRIDDGGDVDKLGAQLLKTLDALGGTPATRRALAGRESTGGRLTKLRAVQDRRA